MLDQSFLLLTKNRKDKINDPTNEWTTRVKEWIIRIMPDFIELLIDSFYTSFYTLSHNIIILISSYPFISLINCPWLLFLLSTAALFPILPGILTGIPRKQRKLQIIIIIINLIIISELIIAINYWIRDVIREYIKKYEVIIIMLFIVFLIFVFSEGMLFISFFWASFHSSCSPIIEDAAAGLPDPCELTYTNTLILSNAALSLGCAFICRESNQNLSIISFIPFIPFILAWTFILLQLKEFRNMAFYINDSIFGSIFFFLTGLHFFHVVVGIILISIILGIVSIHLISIHLFHLLHPLHPFLHIHSYAVPYHLYYNLQLIYWHFIELLWLFIYTILYSY